MWGVPYFTNRNPNVSRLAMDDGLWLYMYKSGMMAFGTIGMQLRS